MGLFSKVKNSLFGSGGITSTSWRLSGGLADGLFGTNFVGDYDAKKNFDLQKAQLQYQKDLQQQIFNREDTAVQRRAADLKAAGMNPLLAVGSAAQSGAVVNTTAPQRATPRYNVLESMSARAGIEKTMADTMVSVQTAENLKEQNSNLQQQNMLMQAQAAEIYAKLSGKTFYEAGLDLFGAKFHWKKETYNNQNTTPTPKKSERRDFQDFSHLFGR